MSASLLPEPHEHVVTPTTEPDSLEVIRPIHERLMEMPVDSGDKLRAFLDAWEEFSAWIGERRTELRIRTSVDTEDEAAHEQYMHMVREIQPTFEEWTDAIHRKIVNSPGVDELQSTPYGAYIDQVRRDLELYRPENVELQRDIQEHITTYQQISGAWTVEFQGEERPIPAMRRFYADPDRDIRREAMEQVADRRLEDADTLDDLFEQMFTLRNQMALNAGFDNFRDYAFADMHRDYDTEACFAFHEIVEQEVVPLQDEIAGWVTDSLGLDIYRPWDVFADPQGGAPPEPFDDVDELKDGVGRMMTRLSPTLGKIFGALREQMDLESRPKKAPGGFMSELSFQRRPFIFANASGVHSDIVTLLHEAGHAFHSVVAADNTPVHRADPPIEFAEVASMSMELLHYDTLDEFYDDEDEKRRAIVEHLRRLPSILVNVAKGDAFQHWLYTHPEHTREERHAKWLELDERFSGFVNWSGLDQERRAKRWHQTLHFFIVPFYFIEYGFAQLGALQVAANAEEDREEALRNYLDALRLGPTKDVFGLYDTAGAEFVPTREKVAELMDWIRERLFT